MNGLVLLPRKLPFLSKSDLPQPVLLACLAFWGCLCPVVLCASLSASLPAPFYPTRRRRKVLSGQHSHPSYAGAGSKNTAAKQRWRWCSSLCALTSPYAAVVVAGIRRAKGSQCPSHALGCDERANDEPGTDSIDQELVAFRTEPVDGHWQIAKAERSFAMDEKSWDERAAMLLLYEPEAAPGRRPLRYGHQSASSSMTDLAWHAWTQRPPLLAQRFSFLSATKPPPRSRQSSGHPPSPLIYRAIPSFEAVPSRCSTPATAPTTATR